MEQAKLQGGLRRRGRLHQGGKSAKQLRWRGHGGCKGMGLRGPSVEGKHLRHGRIQGAKYR